MKLIFYRPFTAASREKKAAHPNPPKSLADLDFDNYAEELRTRNGRSFVVRDSGRQDPKRVVIFALLQAIAILATATRIFVDGTFWVAPTHFMQLVSLHAFYRGRQFPLLFALLPSKDFETYNKMFSFVIDLVHTSGLDLPANFYFKPDFLSDFETGLLSSLRFMFPYSAIRGCYFHFAQCVYRNVKLRGFQTDYVRDPEFRQKIRCLIALGFVPHDLKEFVLYHECWSFFASDPRVYFFLTQYFIPQWMQGTNFQLWDWFKVGTRTNNHLEGWHSGLKKKFPRAHPVIWEFVDHLKEEATQVLTDIEDRTLGQSLPRVNETYQALNSRILTICSEFHMRPKLEFLKALAAQVPDPAPELSFGS